MFKHVDSERVHPKRALSLLLAVTMIAGLAGCESKDVTIPEGWSTYDNGIYQVSFDEGSWDATQPAPDLSTPGVESFNLTSGIPSGEDQQTAPASGAIIVLMSMNSTVNWDTYLKAQLEVDKSRGEVTKAKSSEVSTGKIANYYKEYRVGSGAGSYLKIMQAIATPSGSVIASSLVFTPSLEDGARSIHDTLAPSGSKPGTKTPEFASTIGGKSAEPASNATTDHAVDPTPAPGPAPDISVPSLDMQPQAEVTPDVPAPPAGGATGTITAPFVYKNYITGETAEYLVYYTEPDSLETAEGNTQYYLTYNWGTVEINSMPLEDGETASSILQEDMDREVGVMESMGDYSNVSTSDIQTSEHGDLYCEVNYTTDAYGSKYVTQRLADKVDDGRYILYTTSMKLNA